MRERGVFVEHSTIHSLLLSYVPDLNKRIRPHLNPTNVSWRVDETYVQVKGEWKYLPPCGGFSRQHARFSAEWEAGWLDWVNRTQEWTINTCALGCSGWHLSVLSSKKAGLFQLENIEGKHHESD